MYYLLNLIKCLVKKTITEKNTGKWEKILEKSGKSQGILSVRKSGNPGQAHEIKENVITYFRWNC